ncbi:hypothetical protein [Clostridium sp. VAP52]|uniref:hypothetical protein n=1 Tax=Clostridium sp. VAP52 TaxID=2949977 RepID=UPI002079A3EB|nr:hypothetical protein [Clostridium sp. VAP52]
MKIRENDTFIMIDNKYIRDGDYILTSEQLTILTLISMNLSCKGVCIFSITWLLDVLNHSRSNTRKVKEIKQTLQEFINDNIVKFYTNVLTDDNIITDISIIDKNDLLYCYVEEVSDFTMIYDRELLELINISYKNKLDTYSLINFVIYIYSFIDNNEKDEDYKLCYPSFDKINDEIGLSEATIIKYINILLLNKIIDCDYAGFKETTKGKIRNSKMFYCRYEDKEILHNRVNDYRIKEGFIKQNKLSKNKTNLKRSIKQKINKLNDKLDKNIITDTEQIRLELLQTEYEKIEQQEE